MKKLRLSGYLIVEISIALMVCLSGGCGIIIDEGNDWKADILYINETYDTIFLNDLTALSNKNKIAPDDTVICQNQGDAYFGEIRDVEFYDSTPFKSITYSDTLCDRFGTLATKGRKGPTDGYSYEVQDLGGQNFILTFRFTEALKKEARPCQ